MMTAMVLIVSSAFTDADISLAAKFRVSEYIVVAGRVEEKAVSQEIAIVAKDNGNYSPRNGGALNATTLSNSVTKNYITTPIGNRCQELYRCMLGAV